MSTNTTEMPVFFYGAANVDGFLSNMFISHFVHNGITYNCVEQFFQAEKATMFGDDRTRNLIMNEEDPKKQKILGRKVDPFNKTTWDAGNSPPIFIASHD